MRNYCLAISILLFAALVAPAGAVWLEGYHFPGLNGIAWVLTGHQGHVIVGGPFTTAGNARARHIAMYDWNSWHPLGDGLPDRPASLHSQGDSLFVCTDENRVMLWDGATWSQLGQSITRGPMAWYQGSLHVGAHRYDDGFWTNVLQTGQTITGLAVHGGDLIATGEFQSLGGVEASHVVAWNDGLLTPLGAGIPEAPRDVLSDDGLLYALDRGGYNDTVVLRIWDGSSWLATSPGTIWESKCMTAYDGDIYVAGRYGSGIDPPIPERIAVWKGTWWDFPPETTYGYINDMADVAGLLVIGGSFDGYGGTTTANLAFYDGVLWMGLFTGGGVLDYLSSLVPLNAGVVRYRRVPTQFWDHPTFEFLTWNGDGWSRFFQQNGYEYTGLLSDGTTLAAIGNEPYAWEAWDVLIWRSAQDWQILPTTEWAPTLLLDGIPYAPGPALTYFDGSSWASLTASVTGEITTLGAWNGQVVASGPFSAIDGQSFARIALYDGSDWSSLHTGLDAPARILAQWGDELVAAGDFTEAGGTPVHGLAAWDGVSWRPLGHGPVVGHINAIADYEGFLYVAGEFSALDGTPAANIAVYDGNAWHGLYDGVSGPVSALAENHGRLYLGGEFEEAGPYLAHHFAAWYGHTIANELHSFEAARGIGGVEVVWTFSDPTSGLALQLVREASGTSTVVADLMTDGTPGMRFFDAGAPLGDLRYSLVLCLADGQPTTLGSTSLAATSLRTSLTILDPCPNPCNPSTVLGYELVHPAAIQLAIHDLRGRRVRRLWEGTKPAGAHQEAWDGRDDHGQMLPSGVYFARFSSDLVVGTRKLVLTR